MQMRLFISSLLINYSRPSSIRVYLWSFGPRLMKDVGGWTCKLNKRLFSGSVCSSCYPTSLLFNSSPICFFFNLPLCVKYATNVILLPFFLWGKLRKRLSRNNVKTSGYSEASFMSCQHLQKHVCCGRMRADLRDAYKMRSHCWSIGPGGTALIFPASDFWDWSTGELFFPERVSLHGL